MDILHSTWYTWIVPAETVLISTACAAYRIEIWFTLSSAASAVFSFVFFLIKPLIFVL